LDFNKLNLPRLNARQAKALAAGGGAIALVFGLGAGWLAREPIDAALARTPDRPAQTEVLAPLEAPAETAATPPPAQIAFSHYRPAPAMPPAPSAEDRAASVPDTGPPAQSEARDDADDGPRDDGPREIPAPPPYPPGPDDGD
jgi:hypothetical protein